MRKKLITVLIVLGMLLSISSIIIAQGGDILDIGDSVTDTAEEADVEYLILLNAGDVIEIDLQSDEFDTLVRILDEDGEELAEDDDGGDVGLNSLLAFEAPADGEYTIVVTSFFGDPEGEFTMTISGADASGSTTDTKGSSSADEGDISVGDSITEDASGNVSYDIMLDSGQTVTVDVESDDFDTYLDILDEDGDVIASDDDGGEVGFNSRLEFTAPASGTYTLLIRSFAGEADGEFTITVSGEGAGNVTASSAGDDDMIAYDETITISPDGASSILIYFDGEEGDVINLYAISSGDEDSKIFLYDPDGEELIEDDDSGVDANPYIRRFVLPATGTYEIDLQGFGESELLEDIDLTLELTELLEVTTDGITVTLGEDLSREILAYEADDDMSYLLSMETDEDLESSLFIDLLQEEEFFASTRFTVSGASSFAAIFTADETGMIVIELEYFGGFSGDVDVTISIEPIK